VEVVDPNKSIQEDEIGEFELTKNDQKNLELLKDNKID